MKARLVPISLNGQFTLGQLVMTAGISDAVNGSPEFARFVWTSIHRHARCDWGDVSGQEVAESDFSLKRHLRLLSAYTCHGDLSKSIWIITEADRSATTVLFPSEY